METIEDFQTLENILQIMKNEELGNYNRLLHRIRSIDAEFKVNKYRRFIFEFLHILDFTNQ